MVSTGIPGIVFGFLHLFLLIFGVWFTGSSCSQQIPNVIRCNGISFISSFISCTTTVHWIQDSWCNVIFHYVITICQQSCQKVDLNISQVSVILLGGVGNITYIMHSSLDSRPMGTPSSLDIRHGSTVLPCYWHLVVITGDLFKFVHLRPYNPHYWHLVVAAEVDSTHPTEMLSCLILYLVMSCNVVTNNVL